MLFTWHPSQAWSASPQLLTRITSTGSKVLLPLNSPCKPHPSFKRPWKYTNFKHSFKHAEKQPPSIGNQLITMNAISPTSRLSWNRHYQHLSLSPRSLAISMTHTWDKRNVFMLPGGKPYTSNLEANKQVSMKSSSDLRYSSRLMRSHMARVFRWCWRVRS